jgi:hypothetical protein
MERVNVFCRYEELLEELQNVKVIDNKKLARMILGFKAGTSFSNLTEGQNLEFGGSMAKVLGNFPEQVGDIGTLIQKWNMKHTQYGVEILKFILGEIRVGEDWVTIS